MKGNLLFLLPLFANAAQTDIVPRTVNFVIFAAILYFLTAKHIKKLYCSRITTIQARLSELEKNLTEARIAKDEAAKHVETAREEAQSILSNVQEQINAEKATILKNAENECNSLEASLMEKMELENKNAKREVVAELVDNLLDSRVNLSERDLLNVIEKRVSNG